MESGQESSGNIDVLGGLNLKLSVIQYVKKGGWRGGALLVVGC